jgi:type 1 fimbria pilin
MPSIRTVRIAATAAAATMLLAAIAPAADAPHVVVTLTGSVTPNHFVTRPQPLKLHLTTTIKDVPSDANFVLQSIDYQLSKGAVANGKLFPSCSAAKLKAAHGILSKCPKGSKIGTGKAFGTAVALGISSHGDITMFNGPGGKSITVNIDIEHPAVINETFKVPLKKTSGKYGYRSKITVPDTLKTIIGGDIVATKIDFSIFATRTINGVKRGYIEGVKCPKGGKAPIHAEFAFKRRVSATDPNQYDPNSNTFVSTSAGDDSVIICKP